MDKATFLETLRADRAEWEAVLAAIPQERMSTPGVAGDWSVKDVVAHMAWGEREMVGVLRMRALVGSELWNVSQDARNAAVFEENRQRALEDVLAEEPQVFQQLLALLEPLTDEDLLDSGRFAEMPAEWEPWQVIASNTYEHYRQHVPDLRAWLERQPG